jgi:type IV secretion system protein VirB1
MSLPAAAIAALSSRCAPNVAPQTVAAIIQTESQGNPLALNVNGPRQPGPQSTVAAAASTAREYIAAGYSVDLGLGQINSRNMHKLGLTWDTVFDPCTNIAALGQILTQNFKSVASGRHPQIALRLALSVYNTGSTLRGFHNGYVAKVVGNAGVADRVAAAYPEPAHSIQKFADIRRAAVVENIGSSQQPAIRPTPPSAWNVFERAAYARQAHKQKATGEGIMAWAN